MGWLEHSQNSIYNFPVTEALLKASGTELVNFEEFGFTKERSGKVNIVIDGRASGQWIDLNKNTIGAPPGGEASVNIVRWCQWYHPEVSDKAMREKLDELLGGMEGRQAFSSARVYAMQNKEDITLSMLEETLSSTIKEDTANKVICFLCYLLAYSENAQINISLNAPSSSGKSHMALEISKYFPAEDVIKLSYVSPTAFYHTAGEFDEERHVHVVNLERKILIFLDMPHTMLLEKLRSLLSHDEKEVSAKITDRNQRGQNRAKDVVIRGFPSVAFASAKFAMDEQEQTRFLLLSPETTLKKSASALKETVKKVSNEEKYANITNSNKARVELINRVVDIRDSQVKHIVLHDEEKFLKLFVERNPLAKPRHSRDIQHLASLAKGWALLNLGRRGFINGTITTTDIDYEVAFLLWDKISLPQELGVSPYLLSVYKEVIWPSYIEKGGSLERKEIQKKFFDVYNKHLSYRQLSSDFLPALETAGLISQNPSPDKGKVLLVEPLFDPDKNVHTPPENKTSSDNLSEEEFEDFLTNGLGVNGVEQQKEESAWKCSVCGADKYWKRPGGSMVCSVCYPPTREEVL